MDKDLNEVKVLIVEWIRKNIQEAGAGGAVVGLSGGVDSSVVAVLAKEALGDKMLGVIMPCESKDEDADHAKKLAEQFGMTTEFVDLDPAFKTMKHSLPPGNRMADANVKPRLRMLTLYYFANLHNYLVLGTDNRAELMTGYFTKHGDGGVDVLPIAGIYKKDVRELARILGVPDEIVTKPPSAGLWQGQTDEGEMGITYDELDRILIAIERNETEGVDPTKLEKVKGMMKRSEHKRKLPEIFEP